jgi:WD40 repeat protein
MKLLQVSGNKVHSVAFSPDSLKLALSVKTQIELWDWQATQQLQIVSKLDGHTVYRFCHFSLDGDWIIASSRENSCRAIYVKNPKILKVVNTPYRIMGGFVDGTSNLLNAIIHDDASTYPIFFLTERNPIPRIFFDLKEPPLYVQYSPIINRLMLIHSSSGFDEFCEYEIPSGITNLEERSSETPKRPIWDRVVSWLYEPSKREERNPVSPLVRCSLEQFPTLDGPMTISPDGKKFLIGSTFGLVKLWDREKDRIVVQWKWPIGTVHSVAFSQDGLLAVAGGSDGRLVIWDL